MSLKAKIEAVIYASEEPVTLVQLVSLLGEEAQAELDALAAQQESLPLVDADGPDSDGPDPEALNAEALAGAADAESPATAEGPAEPESSVDAEHTAQAAESTRAANDAASPAENPAAPEAHAPTRAEAAAARVRERRLREYFRSLLDQLTAEYASEDRGLEIREVAGGFRFATKPQYHDAVRGFVKSLKPPLKLSLQALETLAVVAYKQPVTVPEISEIRGVESGGVVGSLMARKLVATAGRKQVIGRPILYKTTKEFLVRFGLKDLNELPSIEEFEKMANEFAEAVQEEIPMESHGSTTRHSEEDPAADIHESQADGVPYSDEKAEGDDPSAAVVDPADNVEIDGRISGLPPNYDRQPSGVEEPDSPALDAEVQAAEGEDA